MIRRIQLNRNILECCLCEWERERDRESGLLSRNALFAFSGSELLKFYVCYLLLSKDSAWTKVTHVKVSSLKLIYRMSKNSITGNVLCISCEDHPFSAARYSLLVLKIIWSKQIHCVSKTQSFWTLKQLVRIGTRN